MRQEIIFLKKLSKMKWWVESTKKACATPSYIELFLILASPYYITISAYASLVTIPIGLTSSVIGINKLCNKGRN